MINITENNNTNTYTVSLNVGFGFIPSGVYGSLFDAEQAVSHMIEDLNGSGEYPHKVFTSKSFRIIENKPALLAA